MTSSIPNLTLYYDGNCPLCQAEINFLSRRNKNNLLSFVDINSCQFRPEELGLTCDQALAAMYGRLQDGTLVKGVAAFAQAYRRANLPFMAWVLSIGFFQPIFQCGYSFFARNRHAISKIFGPLAMKIL
jgi:predicted DCC family thiol-disulfide oxidoreductase YuxK